MDHLRVFGAQCWYVVPKKKVKKLDARSSEALMMGYSSQSKGYKLWDISTEKIVVSRDVTFNETGNANYATASLDSTGNDKQVLPTKALAPSIPSEENLVPSAISSEHDNDGDDGNSNNSEQNHADVHDMPTAPRRSARTSKKPDWYKPAQWGSTRPSDEVSQVSGAALLTENIPS